LYVFGAACCGVMMGSFMSDVAMKIVGPLNSYRFYILSILLQESNSTIPLFSIAILWGFAYGFKEPVDTTIYTTIIP